MKHNPPPPSFSLARRWTISLNVVLSVVAMLALVLMVNYLAARHYQRVPVSAFAQTELNPQTKRILQSVTNNVHVIIYFDREEPLYELVNGLLKEYKFANGRIGVETVDYTRDPAAAQVVKLKYKLAGPTDKNLIIFDCNGRREIVYEKELSDLDLEPLLTGKSKEIRRSAFKGELLFTSAIYNVTSPRPLKACFLTGHGEHVPDEKEGMDSQTGFSKFAGILSDNNVAWSRLSALGTNDIPSDCSLLIIAGPRTGFTQAELGKISAYLNNGGRALILFNVYTARQKTGLEDVLAEWGVEVGHNIVKDVPNSSDGNDLVASYFSTHPISAPLINSSLHLVLPRSLRKAGSSGKAGGANVAELVFTASSARIVTDIRNGVAYASPTDVQTNASLAVAVEKGNLKGLTSERGTTRIVVVGDSIFWGNNMIESLANRDFASLTVNWLLDRSELLGSLAARPIPHFRVVMTKSQMTAARWILLLGMPGSVLMLGAIVWVQRRH